MATSLFTSVRCLECGGQMPNDLFPGACPQCGSQWLDAEYEYSLLPENWTSLVKSRPMTMWRYRELLPLPADIQPVTLCEGFTPLIHATALEQKYGNLSIYVKDERRQPTGSFKDRQAAGTVSALKSHGITELVLASTGNAAAAYAAYCAKAGIKLWVFLANNVPAEKVRELALYGAEIVKITGTYDQAKVIASDFARRRNLVFDQGAKAIPGKEGFKSLAYEIAEQLEWRAPDWYIQAVSGGIGPLGVHKGFRELMQFGLVDRIPKLGIIQVDGCAPMARAYERGAEHADPVVPETLIAVLATGNPGFSYELLKKAVDTSGGTMISVNDGETFRAMRRVARLEGLSMEPASSVAFAGLEKLVASGQIKPGETVVINCSGHTFSAEKHVLEDRYSLYVTPTTGDEPALEQLEEQVLTIAVIDDNPNDSRLIRRFLQHYKKYRVFDANNGPDGIELVQQRKPDLVILDLTLPDMDGFTILSQLKSDPITCEIPVVIVSAKALTKNEWQYLQGQAESIWEKGSFRPQELVTHIVKTLGDQLTIPASRQKLPVAGTFGDVQRKRILIVDRNEREVRVLQRLLRNKQRFDVFEAYAAEDAIRNMMTILPDLIILDNGTLDSDERTEFVNTLTEVERSPLLFLIKSETETLSESNYPGKYDSVWIKETLDHSHLVGRVEALLLE